ncbi:MAG: NAD-dependent dehydratase [Candidatus Eremiobacter antarcticus]|nr:SDR family oxidoreductase [Candidatus Eremiobacteraeota bacterium]PZR60825.1 MAG: NAD-dependent dehydratase [Candidatus Eremiobacter sp. RRmetagenome_bin22]
MKVLVTGGGGYIGAVLCQRLLDAGHDVRVLDRLYWGRQPLESLVDRVELVQADVRGLDSSVLAGIEGVVHLAGLSNDPTAEYRPDANWEMNAVATQELAAACRRAGIRRFTFGSSASIYDGLGDGLFDETTDVKPRGAYSRSKHAAEEALLHLAGSEFAPVILRQGTVYGFSPRMRLDLVVNTFIKDALQRGKLFLHGGGWMWRPLVDILDVCEAHIRCLEAPSGSLGGEIFNVVHQNFQIRQLAMLVAGSLSLRGRPVQLQDAPLPALNRNYRCTNRKLHDRLGFTPHVTVLESIETILQELDVDNPMRLAHPRYYNIEWMTMLEEIFQSRGGFTSVWSSDQEEPQALTAR